MQERLVKKSIRTIKEFQNSDKVKTNIQNTLPVYYRNNSSLENAL